MFSVVRYSGHRETDSATVIEQLKALIADETDRIANLANAAALLAQYLTDVSWVGFYRVDPDAERVLVLGPFHGLPACVRIPFDQGVCGKAATTRSTVIVPDVHAFPGHIACDAASASEIVVPLIKDGVLLGVLDVDSPRKARFDDRDAAWLGQFVSVLAAGL